MKKGLYIPSVRPESLYKLLNSIVELGVIKDWEIYIYLQCYSPDDYRYLMDNYGHLISGVLQSPKRVAPYIARCELMRVYPSDIYCINDDDAVMMDKVNYNTPIQFLLNNKDSGMISTNWVRVNTKKMMARKRYEDKFLKQNLVNTGGGLLFRHDVADKILEKPIKAYLYDDIQLSLNSYISGYKNYRYLGSIIEHNAVMNGGIKTLYKEQEMCLLDGRLVNMKPTTQIYDHVNNNYHMPTSSNLTEKAHKLHKQNNANI